MIIWELLLRFTFKSNHYAALNPLFEKHNEYTLGKILTYQEEKEKHS